MTTGQSYISSRRAEKRGDETVIKLARADNAYVLSNNRFVEFESSPAIKGRRLIKHEIVTNTVLVHSDRLVDPIEEGYEAIVRIGPFDQNLAMVARPLQPYRLVACASPAYLNEH